LRLLTATSDGDPPTPEEVVDMAEYLGVIVKKEPDLMWIAKQAVQCALPPNWVEAEDDDGNAFFHNTSTGQSQAKHPMDDYFSALVVEERNKLPRRRAALVAKSKGRRGKGRHLYARTMWMQFEEPPVDALGIGTSSFKWGGNEPDENRRRRRLYYHNFLRDYSTYFTPWDPFATAAATKIQRTRRRVVAERIQRRAAAVRLQAAYRGHVVRDAVMTWKRECAALCVQAAWRMRLAQRRLAREKAARRLQTSWRGVCARGLLRRHIAARSLQTAWRGSRARGDYHMTRAATKAQAVRRGCAARRDFAAALSQKRGATRMQSVWRGVLGRREATRTRECTAATRLQAAARGLAARKSFAALRRLRAATTIQSAARGMFARAEARTERAARTIQRTSRRFIAHNRYVRRAAAATVARWWRAQWQRRIAAKFRLIMKGELRAAAATVQAAWRGHVGRRLAKQTRHGRAAAAAAPALQRAWRGKLGRDAATSRREALTFLSDRVRAVWLSHVWRREDAVAGMMAEWRASLATRIQARWRGVKGRERARGWMAFLGRLEAAAVTAQRFARGRIATRRAERLRRNEAMRGLALERVCAAVRGMRARRALPALRALTARRSHALDTLRPMYADTVVLSHGGGGGGTISGGVGVGNSSSSSSSGGGAGSSSSDGMGNRRRPLAPAAKRTLLDRMAMREALDGGGGGGGAGAGAIMRGHRKAMREALAGSSSGAAEESSGAAGTGTGTSWPAGPPPLFALTDAALEALEALVPRKRSDWDSRLARRHALVYSLAAWQRVVKDFSFNLANSGAVQAEGAAGYLADEALGKLEGEVTKLKKKAAGRAAELGPAAEEMRLALWDELHVTNAHRQRVTSGGSEGGGAGGVSKKGGGGGKKLSSSLKRTTSSSAAAAAAGGDSDSDEDDEGGGGTSDGGVTHASAAASASAALPDAAPQDVSLATAVHEVCVLEAVRHVLAPAATLNARRRRIATMRADLPTRPRDVTDFLAAKASRATNPEVEQIRAGLDKEAPEVLRDLRRALKSFKEVTEEGDANAGGKLPLTFRQMRRMCGIPTPAKLLEEVRAEAEGRGQEIAIARSVALGRGGAGGRGSPQSSAASGARRLKWKLTAAREVARQVNSSSAAGLTLNAAAVETIKSGGGGGAAGSKVGAHDTRGTI
jgi:hypothetical protein